MDNPVLYHDRKYVSYSSISTYNSCQAKFYYSYIEGKRQPSSVAQKYGTIWHQLLDLASQDSWTAGQAVSNIQDYMDPIIGNATTDEEEQALTCYREIFSVLLEEYINRYGVADRREISFDVPYVNDWTIQGSIDGIQGDCLVEDKLLTRRFFDVNSQAALAVDAQVDTYLWIAHLIDLPTKLDYRITFKPTIFMRTKRNPETPDEYNERLRMDVYYNPASYFWNRVYEKDFDYLNSVAKTNQHAALETIKKIEKHEFSRNTGACKNYGGCHFIKECSDA